MSQKPWEHAKSSGSEADPVATRFVASLDVDQRLYPHDIAGSIAHATMLHHVGLLTDDELSAITTGLNDIKSEIDAQGASWPGWTIELEDVHMCIEAALIERIGEPGRKLHTGRSRNDQVAHDIKVWCEYCSQTVMAKLDELIAAFYKTGEAYGEIVMPSYTHLQRAQPIAVGGELSAWITAFGTASERFHYLSLIDESDPLGSGAIAGSSLPLDRDESRSELFDPMDPPTNSIYSTANRDRLTDMTYALSMTAQWLSRWAEQWIIYNSTEFGFITLGDAYTTGSSMMPQKRNPDMLELIRGKTGQVYGSLVALLTMCKGLTIGYNRDLQEDKRHLFSAYDTVCDCLDIAAGIVRTTTFNEARIKQGLDRGYLDATSLAEYLVTKGVAFRTAHQIVGALVRQCDETDRYKLEQLSVEEMNQAVTAAGNDSIVTDDVYDWLGPENVVKRYQTAGNAGLTGFREQLAAWKQRFNPPPTWKGEVASAGE